MNRPAHLTPDLIVTSADNPKLKLAKSLRDRRDRDEKGLFLIEGYRELSRAILHKVSIHFVLYCPSFFLGTNEESLLESCKKDNPNCFLIEVKDTLFEKLSYRDRPDGLIAVAHKMNLSYEQTLKAIKERASRDNKPPFVVIAEAIEKPGNLGTILRSADAAGVHAVIVANSCTDMYNPNVVRASVGTLFTLPVAEMTNEEALKLTKDLGLSLIAASPEGPHLYTDIPMNVPLGVVVGTEQTGLTPFWKSSCNVLARIPMHGTADSLNVATATTLFLFEAVRQRALT